MASDEEIERQISRMEGETDTESSGRVEAALAEHRKRASDVHDELARRIDRLEDRHPDPDTLQTIVDRLDRLERRLDALESNR